MWTIEAEERLEKLKRWCNSCMIAGMLNKHVANILDKKEYKAGEVSDEYKKMFHVRPLYGKGFLFDKGKGDKRIGNIEINYRRYCPKITFEEYCKRF